MSCQNDCKLDANFACLLCDYLFCSIHGEMHFSELNHPVQTADDKIKSRIHQNMMKKALKFEKSKRIHQATLNTCLAISNLEKISQMQINSIKSIAKTEDFIVVNFEFKEHLLYLARAGMINKGIYYISNENISELTSSWDKNIEEIENLRGLIKNFEVEKGKLEAEIHQNTIIFDQLKGRINKLEAEKLSLIENFNKLNADSQSENIRIEEEIKIQEEKRPQGENNIQDENIIHTFKGTN